MENVCKGKEYLIAIDIEGIHGIVGEPMKTATEAFDYELALTNATKETNVIVRALFDLGAARVSVWPNHGSPRNFDVENLDPRADYIMRRAEMVKRGMNPGDGRFYFKEGHHYDGLFLVGYHAREGTRGGVLAHTFWSTGIQYYKLNGKPIGEVECDSYVAAWLGFPTVFVASDAACIAQAKAALPGVRTVITKYGKSRNSADFVDEDALYEAFYRETVEAVKNPAPMQHLAFPCEFEVRYTRMEVAETKLAGYLASGLDVTMDEEDCHILRATLRTNAEFEAIMLC